MEKYFQLLYRRDRSAYPDASCQVRRKPSFNRSSFPSYQPTVQEFLYLEDWNFDPLFLTYKLNFIKDLKNQLFCWCKKSSHNGYLYSDLYELCSCSTNLLVEASRLLHFTSVQRSYQEVQMTWLRLEISRTAFSRWWRVEWAVENSYTFPWKIVSNLDSSCSRKSNENGLC